MNKRKLAILGASGQGKVVADIAKLSEKYQQIFFLDDSEAQKECMNLPILGRCEKMYELTKDTDFFVAVGNSKTRRRLMEELRKCGADIATLIHPGAVIGSKVQIGEGTVIMAGAVLNPECRVGDGCIINTCASVDHDCVLGDYVHVSVGAHLAGAVTVGDETWIGAGAIVNNNLNIVEGCMIGSGAVVVKDVKLPGTYVGVPAGLVTS